MSWKGRLCSEKWRHGVPSPIRCGVTGCGGGGGGGGELVCLVHSTQIRVVMHRMPSEGNLVLQHVTDVTIKRVREKI